MDRGLNTVVLRDQVRRAQVEAEMDRRRWPRTGEIDRGHFVMASVQWTPSRGTTVTYLEDHTGGARFVRIEGPPPTTRELARDLAAALPSEPVTKLIETAWEPGPAPVLVRVAGKLAACRPERCEHEHLAALANLFEHEHPAVRRAAIRTAYRYRWPELKAVVERRIGEDERLRPQLEHLRDWLDAG